MHDLRADLSLRQRKSAPTLELQISFCHNHQFFPSILPADDHDIIPLQPFPQAEAHALSRQSSATTTVRISAASHLVVRSLVSSRLAPQLQWLQD